MAIQFVLVVLVTAANVNPGSGQQELLECSVLLRPNEGRLILKAQLLHGFVLIELHTFLHLERIKGG